MALEIIGEFFREEKGIWSQLLKLAVPCIVGNSSGATCGGNALTAAGRFSNTVTGRIPPSSFCWLVITTPCL
jgi:hypothetical protein